MTQFERSVLDELQVVGASLRSSAAKQEKTVERVMEVAATFARMTDESLKRQAKPPVEAQVGAHLWQLLTDLDEDQRVQIAEILTEEQLATFKLALLAHADVDWDAGAEFGNLNGKLSLCPTGPHMQVRMISTEGKLSADGDELTYYLTPEQAAHASRVLGEWAAHVRDDR